MNNTTINLKRIVAEANEAVRACEKALEVARMKRNRATLSFRKEMLLTGAARI